MRIEPGAVAVVTGAASGIGYALTDNLLQRGCRVVAADIETDALKQAATQLGAPTGHLLTRPVDVANDTAVTALADATLAAYGRVDLLCNNAGVTGAGGPMWQLDPRDWRWALDVNLTGVVHGIAAFVPAMVERGRGHVLNVASLSGLTSPPFTGPYNASKHAVVVLTETLAAELALIAPEVGATVACPGFVDTRIYEAERNRPAALRHTPAPPHPVYQHFATAFAELATTPQQPAQTAALILDGVERGDLHVLTHPEMNTFVDDRLHRLRTSTHRTNQLPSTRSGSSLTNHGANPSTEAERTNP